MGSPVERVADEDHVVVVGGDRAAALDRDLDFRKNTAFLEPEASGRELHLMGLRYDRSYRIFSVSVFEHAPFEQRTIKLSLRHRLCASATKCTLPACVAGGARYNSGLVCTTDYSGGGVITMAASMEIQCTACGALTFGAQRAGLYEVL
jgi:hypothetical protein